MRILVKRVGEPAKVETIREAIKESVEDVRSIIGGNMEVVVLDMPGLMLICNENGKLDGLPNNITIYGEPIAGDVCFVSTVCGDIVDITDEQVFELVNRFGLKK
jgi:hypothetical protein